MSKSSKPAEEAEEDDEIEMSFEANLILSPVVAVCFIQPDISRSWHCLLGHTRPVNTCIQII